MRSRVLLAAAGALVALAAPPPASAARLSDEHSYTRTAEVGRLAVVRVRPRADSRVVARLHRWTEDRLARGLPVAALARAREGSPLDRDPPEQGRSPARGTLRLRTTKGTCHRSPPRFCNVGNLRRGQRATITVTVRPTRTGRFPNIVAVHTATRQRTSRGKRARAALTVVPASSPRFTG